MSIPYHRPELYPELSSVIREVWTQGEIEKLTGEHGYFLLAPDATSVTVVLGNRMLRANLSWPSEPTAAQVSEHLESVIPALLRELAEQLKVAA